MNVIDTIALCLIRCFVAALNLLPLRAREWVFTVILKIIFAFIPAYKKIAFKNLQLVFPDKSAKEHEEIYQQSIAALGRIFIDLARLKTLDEAWVRAHVNGDDLKSYVDLKKIDPSKGIILATGHLGSFELLAHSLPVFTSYNISFVARGFNLPKVNAWWNSIREANGNKTIDRQGAVKDVFDDLKNGRDVGILFDQNVKRNHAIFVPFCGRVAATSKIIGLGALKLEAPILVITSSCLGNDRYRINCSEVKCSDIYESKDLSVEQKVIQVTERVSVVYEQMLRAHPGEWFWFHRRWKTAPLGEKEDFYS